jgi:putative Mg2+ transporter-C (MgtC) family protein
METAGAVQGLSTVLSTTEISIRIAGSVAAGTLVGLERMWRHKEAGLKTNTLVCLGASVFAIISSNSYFLPNWSASQFSIGVITGVGFLGSGIILQNRGHVQGVNSAATIWVSAGIGLACGMGEYALTVISLTAALVVQFTHRWIENRTRPLPPV